MYRPVDVALALQTSLSVKITQNLKTLKCQNFISDYEGLNVVTGHVLGSEFRK